MSTTAIDWELHEGLALRHEEALALAERERRVRALRVARRARDRAHGGARSRAGGRALLGALLRGGRWSRAAGRPAHPGR
ncbi:hypothetical protein [Kineococcus sp. SYSU DK006]|uniref:hypothetical protein n=1 Tax=Kineococcus sp. SYSU DK006 TaxID=3383127 RepID=UPI003D7CC1E3